MHDKAPRFLTLYTAPADFFISIDSPGGALPATGWRRRVVAASIRAYGWPMNSAIADEPRQSKASFSS
jgi:hypothetical protein